MIFLFENHRLDPERRELICAGESVPLEPQVFDVLLYLLEHRDRVVGKDELFDKVWDGRIVSESTLTSRINAVRRAINDTGKEQRLLRTIARKGFRFVGDVEVERPAAAPPTDHAASQDGEPPRLSLPALDRTAIAVLPFSNLSDEAEQEYFSDGISEDIITALSKLRWFYVIARNSSFVYKNKSVHLKQIGDELGVAYVIEGSVRKDGERVRITAQLNEVATGSHIWAERYDRDLADVFAVQDEITESIVAAIEPQLYAAENFKAQRKAPDSMDAWDLVMRALSHYWRVTRQDNTVAQALLEKAIKIDPQYGQALGVLAASHTFGAHWQQRFPLRRAPRWRPFAPTARMPGPISGWPACISTRAALMIALPNSNLRSGLIPVSRLRAAITVSRSPIAAGGRMETVLPAMRCASVRGIPSPRFTTASLPIASLSAAIMRTRSVWHASHCAFVPTSSAPIASSRLPLR